MPIYEYRCEQCDTRFEHLQGLHEQGRPSCPSCTTGGVQRLMSASSFQLKGSGWYATDYKRGSKSDKSDRSSAGQESS